MKLETLRALARGYPSAYEESPWGELAAKVNGKAFAFYGTYGDKLNLTVKLPMSSTEAAERRGVEPSGYGLGKHGWVSMDLKTAEVDDELVRAWLEESYRAVAPKRLAQTVPEGGPEPFTPGPMAAVPANAPQVCVVSEDELRAERLVRALAEVGLQGMASTATAAELADVEAAVIVVDVGRSKAVALDVAGELALIHFDVPLLLVGIQDAKTERQVAALTSGVQLFRKPPGDPDVVQAIRDLVG